MCYIVKGVRFVSDNFLSVDLIINQTTLKINLSISINVSFVIVYFVIYELLHSVMFIFK